MLAIDTNPRLIILGNVLESIKAATNSINEAEGYLLAAIEYLNMYPDLQTLCRTVNRAWTVEYNVIKAYKDLKATIENNNVQRAMIIDIQKNISEAIKKMEP